MDVAARSPLRVGVLMTAGRDQVRRDAEELSAVLGSWVDAQEVRELAGDCLALLSELEQAERTIAHFDSVIEALREPCAECGYISWKEVI